MPPALKYREVIKAFKNLKFIFCRQKGSHERWSHPDGRKLTIPKHKEIAYGTLNKICKQQAKITMKEFFNALNNESAEC